MSKYDFKKAKQIIEQNKNLIISASLGMHEDWFWTATDIFKDGEFLINLDEENLNIAGISGSSWATPKIELTFKDGTKKAAPCFSGDLGGVKNKPPWFSLGVLSSPCQDHVTPMEEEIKNE